MLEAPDLTLLFKKIKHLEMRERGKVIFQWEHISVDNKVARPKIKVSSHNADMGTHRKGQICTRNDLIFE